MSNLICPQCGATFREGAKFCHVCGYKIPESNMDGQQSQSAPPDPMNIHTYSEVKIDELVQGVKSGNIFKRAFAIMFQPAKEWKIVSTEKPVVPALIFGYSLIFALIPLVTIFVGYGLVGHRVSFGFGTMWVTNLTMGVSFGFIFVLSALAAIIAGAVIISSIAPAFKSEKDFGRALQLTAYSFTPMYFAAIFYLLPNLWFLVYLAGLYGVFIVLTGLPNVLKVPKAYLIGYFFTSIGILYGLFFTVQWIFRSIVVLVNTLLFVHL